MEATKDDMKKEIGHLYMETVMLRQALSEEQQEIAKLTTEVGTMRMQHTKLSATAMAQEENLIALNVQLMGKAAPREAERGGAA